MGSRWRKAKMALGKKMCLYVPGSSNDSPPTTTSAGRFSDVLSESSTPGRNSGSRIDMPTTPVPSSSGLLLPKYSFKSSKSNCAICLNTMKPGQGHAIFTAECSHSFHFHCITSNVKHGNQVCPVCRAKWKEIPFKSPVPDVSRGMRNNRMTLPQDDTWMSVLRRMSPPRVDARRHVSFCFPSSEPTTFDDDELVNQEPDIRETSSCSDSADSHPNAALDVKAYPELSALPRSAAHCNFNVLVHLKAPLAIGQEDVGTGIPLTSQQSRAPVDLITVLDVSGSMAGTKLALLKRAMGFVIQNLGPSDRLSVIAFSSTARRLFPLRRMTGSGRQEALQAVNSLTSSGGTNIVEGLKKGAKVMTERRWKNPVGSIILLSDGQDTYTVSSPGTPKSQTDYQSLLPDSMHRNNGTGPHIPVHAFGFGTDHDAVSMHSISETSGGTFSFIEEEAVIQDAFAQCIGGLLSVVVQELVVHIECAHPNLRLSSIKAGSYKSSLESNGKMGIIEVGDLYAEEERDFMVTLDIPVEKSRNEMSLVKVKCVYKHPLSKEVMVTLNHAADAKIERPERTGQTVVSMEVDKQLNRLRSAEAISEAKAAAEHGDLSAAVSLLDLCRKQLTESVSWKTGDRLSVALDAELKEMQERMSNRQIYETTGRAYVLSGLSSHSWQRATARGDSTDNSTLLQAYQTPSMVDMVNRSQTMIFGSSTSSHPSSIRPTRSFPARPQPR